MEGQRGKDNTVCILGAGPGGVATALRLSYLGIPSILIDKARFPREKVCGDAISGKVTTLLHRLDPAILARLKQEARQIGVWGIRFVAPNGRPVDVPFRPSKGYDPEIPPGFVMPRLDFDHFLIREVERRKNIQFHPQTEVRAISRLPEGGFQLCSTDGKLDIRTPFLVDASGANSRFGREVGGLEDESTHYALAVRTYLSGVSGFQEGNFIELHFQKDILPGYFWIFPLPGGQANVGLGILKKQAGKLKMPLREKLLEILDTHPRFRDAKRISPVRGYGLPLGSKARPLSGDHYVLVGDAGKLIDPLTGEGIGNAFYSGFIAAELAAQCLAEKEFSAARLKAYDVRVARVLGSEMQLSYRMQRAGRYPWLLNRIAGVIRSNQGLIDSFSHMLIDLDHRQKLVKPAFWLQHAWPWKKVG